MQEAGHMQARFQTILMKTVARPCAAIIGVVLALQCFNLTLRPNGGEVKNRMRIVKAAMYILWRYFTDRIQRHDYALRKRQRLQHVE